VGLLRSDQPLALYMQGALEDHSGKMGFGVLRYSPNPVTCIIDSITAGRELESLTGIPRQVPIVPDVHSAIGLGAQVLVLGIAPPGGLIPESWYPIIDEAVDAGLSVVNGLHDLLGPRYSSLREHQWIWDVRVEPKGIGVGTGAAAGLSNKRVLMIGTDMSVGKMTAGLELQKELQSRGMRTGFVATGQIGITITGSGVPLDAVRVDYASGAIEREVMARNDDQVVIIEGQGALIHPGSTANLPLLRGSMPTHLVLCHRARATSLQKLNSVRIPPFGSYIRLYEDLAEACGTFLRPTTIGVALNTSMFATDEAAAACREMEEELGLPVTDPVRFGMSRIAEQLF
jgi:uncharacterized NAD-dependent epimerase/dehydratase family protein